MKKRFALIIFVVLFSAVSLTACGRDARESTAVVAAAESTICLDEIADRLFYAFIDGTGIIPFWEVIREDDGSQLINLYDEEGDDWIETYCISADGQIYDSDGIRIDLEDFYFAGSRREQTNSDYAAQEVSSVQTSRTLSLFDYPLTGYRISDYIWAQTVVEGKTITFVSDYDGNILFTMPDDVELTYYSDFTDGYAYYRTKNNEVVIIDAQGNKHYSMTETADELMLGNGNGVFFKFLYQDGIDGRTCTIIAINPDGVEIADYQIKQNRDNSCIFDSYYRKKATHRYIGEGWYVFDIWTNIVLFNPEKSLCYCLKDCDVWMNFGTYSDGILIIDDKKAYQGPPMYNTDMEFVGTLDHRLWHSSDFPAQYELSDNGTIFRRYDAECGTSEYGYRDMDGNMVLSIEDIYPDYSKSATGLWAGYAGLRISGKDGNKYYTIIDESGNMQFEPVRDKILMQKELINETGLLLMCTSDTNEWYLIDTSGNKVHSISADFGSVDIHGEAFERYSGGEYGPGKGYYNGILQIQYYDNKNKYYKLYPVEQAAAMGESKFDVGALTESDIPGADKLVEGEPSPVVEKDYTFIRNFSIEGKWKSVGSYGFGQAQPGAIVAFDGKNCNLYSPADTYAFYSDGDHYILDATSILSGTVSFSVYIVDKDHIDLYYNANSVTELVRVK